METFLSFVDTVRELNRDVQWFVKSQSPNGGLKKIHTLVDTSGSVLEDVIGTYIASLKMCLRQNQELNPAYIQGPRSYFESGGADK